MIEVFPVVLADGELPVDFVVRNGQRKRCGRRIWFADWHTARRGRFLHHAQDIFAPRGSLVLAPEDGVVVASSADTGPTAKGGHYLRIKSGRRTYYLAHLDRAPVVRAGEQVTAGQDVARVGRTGNARNTCPHLHIGARVRGRAINVYQELRQAFERTRPTEAKAGKPRLREAK